jgi:hypothetical protein
MSLSVPFADHIRKARPVSIAGRRDFATSRRSPELQQRYGVIDRRGSTESSMKRTVLGFAAGGLLFAAATVGNAQTTTVIETTGVAPPDEVITFVERERIPSVRIEGDVAVGYVLPDTVEIRTIPQHQKFGYAIVNERRVIVDPGSRKVIRVLR